MKNIPIRHGDINFSPVTKSVGETVNHNGSFIVGYGEATGHHHRITVKNPTDLVIRKDAEGDYYFELKSKGTLSHEEHKTITIPPGTYKKIHEREKDWFSLSVRRVID